MKRLVMVWVLLCGAGPGHWDVRDRIVGIQAAQIPQHVTVVGDSITEGNTVTELCGERVLNAGYGGITARELALRVPTVAPYAGRVVWVLVGTNDAWGPNNQLAQDGEAWWIQWRQTQTVRPGVYQTWREFHAQVVQGLMGTGARVVLVTIPPAERGALVSAGAVAYLNAAVKFLGSAWGLQVVDVYGALTDPQGYMPQGATLDGVHPNGPTYDTINRVLEGGC